jgi:hypothetical protein
VRSNDGELFGVSGCNRTLTFRDLFSIVTEITGIPTENIRLFSGKKLLTSSFKLAACNLKNHSVLYLHTFRLCGGGGVLHSSLHCTQLVATDFLVQETAVTPVVLSFVIPVGTTAPSVDKIVVIQRWTRNVKELLVQVLTATLYNAGDRRDNYISNTPPKRECVRSVSSGVHLALLNLLKGNTVPKKERSPNIIAAYRIQRRRTASCKMAMNPLSGQI